MGDRRVIHLVDDEESIRKAASFALKTAGYDVVTYASGVEFLKEAKSAAVGCVILDVRMPEMDGLEVQAAMAARGVNMPVIVLTGHGDVSVAVQAMKGGAVDFLEKPFEKAALLGAVSRAFARLDDVDLRTLETSEAGVRVAALTPREREVLERLANGLPKRKKKKYSPFVEAFLDKGRMRLLLERVPVAVCVEPRAGLLGAATHAVNKVLSERP